MLKVWTNSFQEVWHQLHHWLLLHHQLLHWDQDAPMPSWTLTIPMLVLQPPRCTIRLSPCSKRSLTAKLITWQCSLLAFTIKLTVSINIVSSPCQSTIEPPGTYSPTMGRSPLKTRGHTPPHKSTLLPEMPKTMTCSTTSWQTR